MPSFEQIRSAKESVEAKLRAFPGVHAVGIGEKYVGGKTTKEMAILVLVDKKRPLNQLKAEDVITPVIEGIKTDVVEVAVPQLQMAANPANLSSQITNNNLTITFSGDSTPGAGLVVTVEFTISAIPFAITHETTDDDQLASIATKVAGFLTTVLTGQNAGTAVPAGAQVTVAPAAGIALILTNVVITAIDDAQYFDKWLRGGIQLALVPDEHGSGTLGCLATTAASATDPQGKVVAITNAHVVEPPRTFATNLTATTTPGSPGIITLGSNDANPIFAQTALIFYFGSPDREVVYLTVQGETFNTVATHAQALIAGLALAGVNVTVAGSVLTFTGTIPTCHVRGPLFSGDDFKANSTTNGIKFTGEIDGDDYGIYVDIQPGRAAPSFGVFVNPPNKTNATGIAGLVVAAFSKLPATLTGGVTITQAGDQVNVTNADLVDCSITDNILAGQPDPSFGSPCSRCCSHRIGRVIAARLDLDVAIIQLDPGLNYKPEIQDLGLVKGVEPPAQPMSVWRRGRTTQRTHLPDAGQVRGTNLSGFSTGSSGFVRLYSNAFMIHSVSNAPFSTFGDSGSAIVNFAGNVIGLLLGGGTDLFSFATPIDQIIGAFPDLALNLAPAPAQGQDPNAVRIVPKPAHMAAAPESLAQATRPVMAGGRLEQRFRTAEEEINAMPAGQQYADLIRRHFDEGQRLVNRNRRVATVWQRNGGPQLLQAILAMIQRRDMHLPREFEGKPLAECLERIRRVMARYGSPRFSADLQQHAPRLAGLAGLSYDDVLSTLESWSRER
jgi:hypothetical protein